MTFSERLASLGFASYKSYLRSDTWQRKREEYVQSGRSLHCYVCRSRRYSLHHRTYVRLGCELLDDLVPLCYHCHTKVHELVTSNKSTLAVAHERLAGKLVTPDWREFRRLQRDKRKAKIIRCAGVCRNIPRRDSMYCRPCEAKLAEKGGHVS